MSLPSKRFSRASRFLAASVVFLLAACLSDGPNQTGLGYLQSEGMHLSTPLYHLTIRDFPVDSVFSTELPLNHLGGSWLLVGRDGPFRASVRMGFQITNQGLRDSIAKGLNLRLVAIPATVIGGAFLKSSTAGHDSLRLVVESFAWKDTAGTFSDSFPVFHRRIMSAYSPFSILDTGLTKFRVKDSCSIGLREAFSDTARDSIQVCKLPNLQSRLTDTTRNWQVFLEVSPRNGTDARDSGMFRFAGNGAALVSGGGPGYDPGLWLGTYVKGGTNTPALLAPYYPSGGYPEVNYQVTYSGSGPNVLYGVSRGMKLRLNRNTLLDSIRQRLGANFPSSGVGRNYDTRFYVPYAEIRLPLADSLARVDGNFALDMQLVSELDSTADKNNATVLVSVLLNQSLKLNALSPPGVNNYNQIPDTLICQYLPHPSDASLRQVILQWAMDSTVRDTFLLTPDGNRHELGLKRHTGWFTSATLGVYPGDSAMSLEVYFSSSSTEPNGFLDPVTRQSLTAYRDLRQRYWKPGATADTLRATHGLRTLLNRASGATPDLFLRPLDNHAFDSTAITTSTDTSSYRLVSFPVLGEIKFPRKNGKLRVTVDIYLYPLRSGP